MDSWTDVSVFQQLAAYTESSANLTGGQEPERVITAAVTPNLFQTLRVGAHVGRTFSPNDSAAAIADHVILGHASRAATVNPVVALRE